MKNPITMPSKMAHNFKNILGQRFGRLLVIEYKGREQVSSNPVKYKSVWLVHCDCGTEKIVRGADLDKKTVSCGCYSKEATAAFNIKTKTKIAYDTFGVVWQSYKRGAKTRDLEFDLTKDQFYGLTQCNCHYCGKPPMQIRKPRAVGKTTNFIYNGVDRIDSDRGYHIDNCVTACKVCNFMKLDMSYEEFKAHIKRIHSHLKL